MEFPKFQHNFLRYLYYIRVFICLLPVFFFSSCGQKNGARTGISTTFKPVYDTVTVLFASNRLDQGIYYLDSAMKHISHANLNDWYKAYAFHYTFEYKQKRDFKKAVLYADSMLSVINQNVNDAQYVTNYVDANFLMGDAYFSMQQYNDAYQHFFKGYSIGKDNLNKAALADYNYRMGMIMYKTENYKFAADYFKESYRYTDKTKGNFTSFYGNQELLDNIALSYKHNNQTDSAIVYFNKALKFIDQYGPQFRDRTKRIEVARGVIYGNEAEVLVLKNDYAGATDLLKKSIAINLQPHHDYNDAELTEIKLAQLYYDHNEDSALISLLNAMRPHVDTIKNETAMADWNRLMSRYYLRKKEPLKALNYLETYNTINDTNLKKLNSLKQSDVNKQLDTFEKQQQIDDLNSKNKFQKIYLLVISLFSVMTLIIILLIYRNWKRSKKDVLQVNVLNEQVKKQNIVLEANSQEKDRMLRSVAHDLRNPLGGIASLTAIMVDEEYRDEQKEQLNLIKETSFNALELINEILEATNMVSVQLNLEWIDINQLAGNSIELLRFKASEKGQQIFFSPLDKQQELYISREKIWRVISNLISNAIKFSRSGASIFVKVTEEQQQVIIAVEDNGIGIPEKLRGEVFNMFTTAQRLGTSGEKSFGLGLSICRQIMEKLNGKIWFESKKEGGTIFFISLPIADKDVEANLSQKISIPLS